mgnify:CR=1 FL=1
MSRPPNQADAAAAMSDVLGFLARLHPYDQMPEEALEAARDDVALVDLGQGESVYEIGQTLAGLYVVFEGEIEVKDAVGSILSHLHRGNSFGERGLLREGLAVTSAEAISEARLICLSAAAFARFVKEHDVFRRFFERASKVHQRTDISDLAAARVEAIMYPDPITCSVNAKSATAARLMRDHRISCLCVTDEDKLVGVLTQRDLVGRVLAAGLRESTPVSQVMTANPMTLEPSAIGSDVLHLMMEHRIGHLPVLEAGRLVGIVTQTDLTRFQATSSAQFVSDAASARKSEDLPKITARIPRLLDYLIAAGQRHDVATRMVTDIADVVTRRLLTLAKEKLGPPPGRYLWLACGSQGRREQTGVSDQDNCVILEDGLDPDVYFPDLAKFVSDGLDASGYVYCPGDMMATNPRWCQPLSGGKGYFADWIGRPGKEAQMLASVMFDLRPIGGDQSLFADLQAETLRMAAGNSIFAAHMASNALTHQTPLGLLRGFATIRSGEHRNTIDLKHNGVVPVVDLARMYALQGQLTEVNTRARLKAAIEAGLVSKSGGRDLLDAYDLIAETRLAHQVRQIRRGDQIDNFLNPQMLSDFERSHLRDAFVVVKTMQSALMQGRGVLG